MNYANDYCRSLTVKAFGLQDLEGYFCLGKCGW